MVDCTPPPKPLPLYLPRVNPEPQPLFCRLQGLEVGTLGEVKEALADRARTLAAELQARLALFRSTKDSARPPLPLADCTPPPLPQQLFVSGRLSLSLSLSLSLPLHPQPQRSETSTGGPRAHARCRTAGPSRSIHHCRRVAATLAAEDRQ